MNTQFAYYEVYTFFLCFMRIAGIISLIPLFSQKQILPQAKIILILLLAIFIHPIAKDFLPKNLDFPYHHLFIYCLFEFGVGFLIGLSGHLLYMAIDLIGHFMGTESGLSNAQTFNPAMGEATTLTTHMLTIGAGVLLFNLQFHHTIIKVMVHSYEHFNFSNTLLIKDFYQVLQNSLSKMFSLGLQFSFPFILIGFVLNLSIGLVNKLIPQIQIFSVMPPAQLFVGFLLFVVLLAHLLEGFTIIFNDTFIDLFHHT